MSNSQDECGRPVAAAGSFRVQPHSRGDQPALAGELLHRPCFQWPPQPLWRRHLPWPLPSLDHGGVASHGIPLENSVMEVLTLYSDRQIDNFRYPNRKKTLPVDFRYYKLYNTFCSSPKYICQII